MFLIRGYMKLLTALVLSIFTFTSCMAIALGIRDEGDRSIAFADISMSLASSHSYRQARLAAELCPSPEGLLLHTDKLRDREEPRSKIKARS